MGSWNTVEDVNRDLYSFSEIIGTNKTESEVSPPTIQKWNARMGLNNSKSIFDNSFPEQDENVTYIISGRGRGGVSTLIKPGCPTLTTTTGKKTTNDEVAKRLREVAGLGCSNEFIEQTVKAKVTSQLNGNNSNSLTKKLPNFSESTSPSGNSMSYAPNTTSESGSSSLTSSPTIEPRQIQSQTVVKERPPPLSVLRKLAKKKNSCY